MNQEPKPLNYSKLEGFSERQIAEHHDKLYVGYVNKYNEIIEKLPQADLTSANQAYSDLRELHHEKSFSLNGIKLHEGYFDGLTDKPTGKPGEQTVELVTKHFGSVEKWQEEFAALGMCARGWVVLAWDYDRQILENYICDSHNQGGVWNTAAIIIMDVYEHAYFLDYATTRKDYITAYMAALNWEEIESRIKRLIPE